MKLILGFFLRWITTSFGLWIALSLLGTGSENVDVTTSSGVVLTAGLILSIVNIFIKPLVSIIALPITIVTLGLFTLIINGLMVYIALQFTPGVVMTFWGAVLAGIIIGIVNYVINETLGALKEAE